MLAAPVTAAMKDWVEPSWTEVVPGLTATATVGTATVTDAVLPVTGPGAGWRTVNTRLPTALATPLATRR